LVCSKLVFFQEKERESDRNELVFTFIGVQFILMRQ